MYKINLGKDGEEIVVQYLKNKNFKILEKNYRQFFGEIDIIAEKDDIINFVEVKTRTNNIISVKELVSISKQNKIIATAKKYILKKNISEKIFRFDVALIIIKNNILNIDFIENAFNERED